MRNFKILNLTLLATLALSTDVLGSGYGGYGDYRSGPTDPMITAQQDVANKKVALDVATRNLERLKSGSRDGRNVRARPARTPAPRTSYDDMARPAVAPTRGSFDRSPLPSWRAPSRVPAMPVAAPTLSRDPDDDSDDNRWNASSLYSSNPYDIDYDSDATGPDVDPDAIAVAPQGMTRDAAATSIQALGRGYNAHKGRAMPAPMLKDPDSDDDNDGIPNAADRMPDRPDVKSKASAALRDSDRDGIPDYRDPTPYGSAAAPAASCPTAPTLRRPTPPRGTMNSAYTDELDDVRVAKGRAAFSGTAGRPPVGAPAPRGAMGPVGENPYNGSGEY